MTRTGIEPTDVAIASTAILACIPFRPGVMIVGRDVARIELHESGTPGRAVPVESVRDDHGAVVIRVSAADIDRITGFVLRFRSPGDGKPPIG